MTDLVGDLDELGVGVGPVADGRLVLRVDFTCPDAPAGLRLAARTLRHLAQAAQDAEDLRRDRPAAPSGSLTTAPAFLARVIAKENPHA